MMAFHLRQVGSNEAEIVYPCEVPGAALQWNDLSGKPIAYTYCVQGVNWMHWPGSVTFRCKQKSDQVLAIYEEDFSRGGVHDLFWRSAAPFFYQTNGLEALHASAVLTPTGILGICAVSGVGKSTLAHGLSLRGYPLWSDDSIVFDCRGEIIRTLALPTKIRLTDEANAYFAASASAGKPAHPPMTRRPAIFKDETVLKALLIVERSTDTEEPGILLLSRLTGIEAFITVLKHALCFSLYDRESKTRLVHNYADFVKKVPTYRARFKFGLDKLPSILDQVEIFIHHDL